MEHFFEFAMLACFGFSWPFSIWKSLKTRQTAGKSPLFMIIVIAGYACGIVHKFVFAYDWVVWVYFIDTALVCTDLALYFVFSRRRVPDAIQA